MLRSPDNSTIRTTVRFHIFQKYFVISKILCNFAKKMDLMKILRKILSFLADIMTIVSIIFSSNITTILFGGTMIPIISVFVLNDGFNIWVFLVVIIFVFLFFLFLLWYYRKATLSKLLQGFQNHFYLTTELLYFLFADKIKNGITIRSMDISNTIEDGDPGNKRDSEGEIQIRGIVTDDTVKEFRILIAGNSVEELSTINFNAFEKCEDGWKKLAPDLVEGAMDSFIKDIIISYREPKKKGDYVNLKITWRWPKMLSVASEDYVTLPIVYSRKIEKVSMKLIPKGNVKFASFKAYKYVLGKKPSLVSVLQMENGVVSFEPKEVPQYKSCYILYYKIDNAK